MKILFDKILNTKKIKSYKESEFEKILYRTNIDKIFRSFSNYSSKCEIRYVGGCVRKILNYEEVDDIDLATNVTPTEVQTILEKNNIKYYNTGLKHGTITASIENNIFEITSLRKDIATDGRYAEVQFTNDWFIDASRRDFSINSIYADLDGNLYDPFNGKKDLKNGVIKFIGDPNKRIQEDYLRILRYIRFFSIYSEVSHENEVIKSIKNNLSGIKKVSKDRLVNELKKLFLTNKFTNLAKDDFSVEILNLIFPELKNISILENLNEDALEIINKKDFIFFLSLLVIDGSDNAEYFLYKYNLANDEKKRLKFLSDNYKNILDNSFFNEKNLSKLHYKEPELVLDLIDFKIFITKKVSKKNNELRKLFLNKTKPIFPIKAINLINEYNLSEGKELGDKIKKLENLWINNNFKISNDEIDKVVRN